MTTPAAKLLVLAEADGACIRIIGRANFALSVDFKALVDELRQRGCGCFLLDLSECVLMDSTFLGVLAGLGLKLMASEGGRTKLGVQLLNPSARIMELLETLGVLHLFAIVQGASPVTPSPEAMERSAVAASKDDLTRTCIEAHQTLMAIDPANVARFKDVAEFLAEGLRKGKND